MVVGTGIETEFRQVAVAIALDGGRLAVGEHVETPGDGVFAPLQQVVTYRCVVLVGSHGMHGQSLSFVGRNIV